LARTPRVETYPQLLTTAQAAATLGVHPNTIRNWADSSILPSYRIGPRRDRRFKRDDLDRFLTDSNDH
jgi:excisionase family DNA binding protein